jgi:hypothetical protein
VSLQASRFSVSTTDLSERAALAKLGELSDWETSPQVSNRELLDFDTGTFLGITQFSKGPYHVAGSGE